MTSVKPVAKDYFLPGDWRSRLKGWIKNNCSPQYYRRYLKSQTGRIRMTEDISNRLTKKGYMTLKAFELRDAIKRCGKTGECQEHKKTKQRRYVGHYCNLRHVHLDCAIRYRNVQAHEMKRQYMEIIEAQNLWGFYTQVYTLTEKIRRWLDENLDRRKEFLLDARRAVAKTINRFLVGKSKLRGVQTGFSIFFHSVSSENPFIQSTHFHTIILPALLDKKKKTIKKFDKKINHALVKQIYKEELDKVLVSYGLEDLIEDQYVVYLQYVNAGQKGKVDHAFKYHNRSQILDILKSIKMVSDDFESYVCLFPNKKEGIFVPCFKSSAQVVNACENILNPSIQARMSYGFMRVLGQYAELLDLELDESEPEKDWIYLYRIEIRRMFKNIYRKEKRKIVPVLIIYIRGPDDEYWQHLEPSDLKGEWGSKGKGKFYKSTRKGVKPNGRNRR